MKKLFSMALGMTMSLSLLTAPLKASAYDPATYQEYRENAEANKEPAFPDPDLRYTIVTEGDYEYHVYDDFAVLSECKNTEITQAVIPGTVNDIPVVGLVDTPFGYCHQLTSITLPDSFEHFSWYDLIINTTTAYGSDEEYVPSVAEITTSENNPYFTVSEGMLYTKYMKKVVGCPPTSKAAELHVSEKADTIGAYAFFCCL